MDGGKEVTTKKLIVFLRFNLEAIDLYRNIAIV